MPRKTPLPEEVCAELQRLYLEERLGVTAVGAKLGRSPATISNWLRDCGITARSGRFRRREISRARLDRLYSVERLPLREIAQRLGISISSVGNKRRAFGIPKRGAGSYGEGRQSGSRVKLRRLAENSLHFLWP